MAAVSQTTFSSVFSGMKNLVFCFELHWILFLRVQLTITQHCLDNGLAPNRRQAITWTNADPIHRCIYAALGGDELTVNAWHPTPTHKLKTCEIIASGSWCLHRSNIVVPEKLTISALNLDLGLFQLGFHMTVTWIVYHSQKQCWQVT